jgi:hypothetical protein
MATDYQALLNAQQNPWLAYLANQGYSPTDLASLTPAAGPTQLTPDQIDSIYGAGYSSQPLYHEAFPGYDGTLQSAIQYADAQMNANKNAGLTNLGLALAGGVTGGLLSAAGAAGSAGNAVGDVGAAGGSGAGSAFGGGGGTSLFGLNGTAPITGTAIDAAGNAIGAPALFGTSSIPFDGGLASAGLGAVGNAAGSAGAGSAASGPSPFSGGADPNAPTSLADPGAQTPGGYDLPSGTQIPNLPGANMASSLPSWLQSLLPYSGLIGAGLGLVDSALQPKSTTTTNGGTSNSTNTSTLQLPSQLTGAAGTALDRANQLLGQGQQFAPTPYLLNHTADQLNNARSEQRADDLELRERGEHQPVPGSHVQRRSRLDAEPARERVRQRGAIRLPAAPAGALPGASDARRGHLWPRLPERAEPPIRRAGSGRVARAATARFELEPHDSGLAGVAADRLLLQQQQQQQLNAPYTNLSQYIGELGGLAPFFPGTVNAGADVESDRQRHPAALQQPAHVRGRRRDAR